MEQLKLQYPGRYHNGRMFQSDVAEPTNAQRAENKRTLSRNMTKSGKYILPALVAMGIPLGAVLSIVGTEAKRDRAVAAYNRNIITAHNYMSWM